MALQFSSPSFPPMVRKKRTGKRKATEEEQTTLNNDACEMKIDVDDIILQMAKGDPTKLRLKDLFKQQLGAIHRTPDHPVYAIMIQEAIIDLNEEGGSTKEAISEFILGKYDVIKVVHPAKLIDQLRKLVGRQEIILTSESRYKVPVENTTDVADLELVEQGLTIHEQDDKGCKPCNSKQVYLLGGPDEFNENQCHTKIGEMNRTMGSQIEEQDVRVCKPCAVEGHLRENHNTISEKQYQLQIEPLKESPVSHLAGSVSQNNSLEEQTPQVIEMILDDERSTKMFEGSEDNESSVPPGFQIEGSESETLTQEEQIVTTTGGKFFQVNEENEKVTDKEAPCGQHVNQVDERDAEKVQDNREETRATEGLSQEKGTAPKEVRDKLQNVGYLLSSLPSKEKFTELRKGIETIEQELRNIIDHLSSVDVPEHVTSLNKAEVFLVPESDPKTVPHSVDTSQDSMQHMWNHQTGDDMTKQKEKGNTFSREEVFKSQLKLVVISADLLLMNLEQLAIRKRQYLSSSECCLEVCGTQKLSECDLVGSSSLPGPLECQMLDLEQQLEPGMQEGPEKRKLSQLPVQDMDNNCQQKHVKCNAAAMASDEVQIPENLPNTNPEAVDNLGGTQKRKRQWQLQQPKRKGLRLRSNGGSQPAETKAENLQSQHVSSRKVKKQLDGRLTTPMLRSNVDAFESKMAQKKRGGRPPKEKATSRTAWRKKVS